MTDHQKHEIFQNNLLFQSTVTNPDGMWKKTGPQPPSSTSGNRNGYCTDCKQQRNNRGILVKDNLETQDDYELESDLKDLENDLKDEVLECGKSVNFTYYDHLVGVQNR